MKEMERIDSGRMMKAFCGGATWTVRSGSKEISSKGSPPFRKYTSIYMAESSMSRDCPPRSYQLLARFPRQHTRHPKPYSPLPSTQLASLLPSFLPEAPSATPKPESITPNKHFLLAARAGARRWCSWLLGRSSDHSV